MSSWLLAFLFGLGVGTWTYLKLAHSNGNANPQSNMMLGALAGVIVYLFVFSLLKLVLNF